MRDAVEVTVPKESANDEFAVLVEWRCTSGQAVREDAVIAVVESSKAVYEVHAPAAGFVFHDRNVGEKVSFGEPIAYISGDAGFRLPEAKRPAPASEASATSFTRKAKKLMERHGVDASVFSGQTRVKEEDVARYVESRPRAGSPPSAAPFLGELRPLPASKVFEVESLRRSSDEVIYSNAVRQFPFAAVKGALSRKSKELGMASPASLGALMVSAAARTLREFDVLNAVYTREGARIYARVNVGVAMNLNKGLKVPVVSDADRLSLSEVNDAMNELALRYMRDELTAHDMADATFTVSDLSSMEVSLFTPLVPYRQSAILGVCSKDVAADFFNVILGFDHRLAEGIYAARFLKRLEEIALS